MRHIFICGAKSIGQYGGYETFLNKLTEYEADNSKIKIHIACKANGQGHMDETKLEGAVPIAGLIGDEFIYHSAHCVKLQVPRLGAATAVYYDVIAMKYWIRYCEEHLIEKPIFYLLTCRIGPFLKPLCKQIKKLGGVLYVNPDGHEWKRSKWPLPVRKYWKLSERLTVKRADLLICDSRNIEIFINQEYRKYNPQTTYISYGADIPETNGNASKWLRKYNAEPGKYYLSVGRLVPENNFNVMLREFMLSNSEKKFLLITDDNPELKKKLNDETQYSKDPRIVFTGPVYGPELADIRKNAYGYIHGHEVGGTNPSLLEGLAATNLCLVYNVGFNTEVCENAAFYWSKIYGSLGRLIDECDDLSEEAVRQMGERAKRRIQKEYSWEKIVKQYNEVFELE